MNKTSNIKPFEWAVVEKNRLVERQDFVHIAVLVTIALVIGVSSKGLTCPQIMEITGSSRRTIQQWVHKYNADAIDSLKDSPRPGQPTKLPREKEFAFCKRIEAGPTGKDGVYVFNGVAIRQILEKEFGASYSLWGIYHLLNRLGYSCLCPRPQHENADPELQKEFKKTSLRRWIKSNQNIPGKK